MHNGQTAPSGSNPNRDETLELDDTARRILNLLFVLNSSSTPLTTERIIDDQDLGYGSGNRDSDKRKFKRDRARLAEAGVMIREVRKNGMPETEESSWEIDRQHTHADAKTLLPEDAQILADTIERTFELHTDNPERWPLHQAYLKLKAASGLAWNHGATTNTAPAWSTELQRLWTCFVRRKTARFTYQGSSGATSERRVDIYGIFSQGARSYLVGKDHDARAIRTFRTDRVQTVARGGGARYEIPPTFAVSNYQFLPFDFSENPPVEATFSFPADIGADELAFMTRGRGHVNRQPDETLTWEVGVRDLDAAARFALEHASSGMRPIGPDDLVKHWNQRIQKAVGAHGGNAER